LLNGKRSWRKRRERDR
jgi:ATP-dependent RNA helicase DDX46/PRP5